MWKMTVRLICVCVCGHCKVCSTFIMSKFAIALPCLLLRSSLRHIILLVPSLSATTPSSLLATAQTSDLALAVEYVHTVNACIVIVLQCVFVVVAGYDQCVCLCGQCKVWSVCVCGQCVYVWSLQGGQCVCVCVVSARCGQCVCVWSVCVCVVNVCVVSARCGQCVCV